MLKQGEIYQMKSLPKHLNDVTTNLITALGNFLQHSEDIGWAEEVDDEGHVIESAASFVDVEALQQLCLEMLDLLDTPKSAGGREWNLPPNATRLYDEWVRRLMSVA
jgi:HPt (histidine-containing phosphotransfer) domain-containing protein